MPKGSIVRIGFGFAGAAAIAVTCSRPQPSQAAPALTQTPQAREQPTAAPTVQGVRESRRENNEQVIRYPGRGQRLVPEAAFTLETARLMTPNVVRRELQAQNVEIADESARPAGDKWVI